MRIAALGRTDILIHTIQQLRERGHDIVLIGTCLEAPEYKVGVHGFEKLAQTLGAKFFNDSHINNPHIVQKLHEVRADVAVSINWLTIMGEEVIKSFSMGVLNGHTGDLPRYRGNACPNWAIIEGEKEIGLSIHFIDPYQLDSGPIILKRYMPISNSTTIGQVYDYIYNNLPEMFVKAIEGLASGTIQPVNQSRDPAQALRCYPRIPSDSFIDWQKDALFLSRLVRASSEPFAGAYTYWQGKKLTIWKATAENFSCPSLAVPGQMIWKNTESGEVGISTGDGVLILHEIQLEGEKRTKAAEILCSLRIRLGMMVEDEIALINERLRRLEDVILDED